MSNEESSAEVSATSSSSAEIGYDPKTGAIKSISAKVYDMDIDSAMSKAVLAIEKAIKDAKSKKLL